MTASRWSDDISDLVVLFDDQCCGPVQERLRQLVADRISDAQDQVATLVAFTAQQRAAARLGAHTPEGPCDADCGCTTDVAAIEVQPTQVRLMAEPTPSDEVPIACTLGVGEMQGRITDWHTALAEVIRREPIERGVRVHLPRGAPITRLAALIEAEQTCCAFLAFTLTIGIDASSLDVTGPDGVQDIVQALVGAPG